MRTAEFSIFIVEDDAHFRETFIDVMALRGVTVRGVSSGKEALTSLTQLDQTPSVILLDVQLPDTHGFELCKRIKRMEAFKKVPVVFLSAASRYNDPRDRVEGLLAGASLFLPKPIGVERLWAEIDFLLKSR